MQIFSKNVIVRAGLHARYYNYVSDNTIKIAQNLIFTQVSHHTLDYMHVMAG